MNLETEIVIEASDAQVWDALLDFKSYGAWNPFITSISGLPVVGSRLTAFLKPAGSAGMQFKPTVLRVEERREFRWLGHLFITGLFDGEHYFKIEPLDATRTRFVQGENFRGILVPLFGSMLQATRAGFDAMNAALKARVEPSSV